MPFFEEIKRMIHGQTKGACLSRAELEHLYREQVPDRIPFEHILCCERCLDVVNDILGLPRLEERDLLGALTRQPSGSRLKHRSGGN